MLNLTWNLKSTVLSLGNVDGAGGMFIVLKCFFYQFQPLFLAVTPKAIIQDSIFFFLYVRETSLVLVCLNHSYYLR
jgi:hypothetical protein